MVYNRIFQVKEFPVSVRLSEKNPWGGKIKINNVKLDYNKKIIYLKEDLDKYLLIEKYIIIESEEKPKPASKVESSVLEVGTNSTEKKTRKKGAKNGESKADSKEV